MLKAIYSGELDKGTPPERLTAAWDAIFDLEMMAVFGGRDQLYAAPAATVQRVWLAFTAKRAAEAEAAKKPPPS